MVSEDRRGIRKGGGAVVVFVMGACCYRPLFICHLWLELYVECFFLFGIAFVLVLETAGCRFAEESCVLIAMSVFSCHQFTGGDWSCG